ncbi:MAG: DUF4082 domain-containing protein [Acidobacteriales bacterium]|nr:DUF4082 domain-containing protein [Terriglobales bacterium]
MRTLVRRGFWLGIRGIFLCSLLSTAAFSDCATPANSIVAENCKLGSPDSEWNITGAGDPSIQGFATDMSFNVGATANFKIKTDASAYSIDIYRMGYYAGMGARKVASILPSASLPQIQPACVTDTTVGLGGSGLFDCGNWAVSASWPIPANATSGIYFALLKRPDTGGRSHIFFVVRNDSGHSDLLFQTSDTTWQAYNHYGLGSLYGSNSGTTSLSQRSFKVSYNRPFITRDQRPHDFVFDTEYPMVRWLEANGFDVSYFSGVDTARFPSLLLQHKVFLSVGHDEYWSGDQRANVEAARAAGVNLAFFSANEAFWKTRWEASIDGSTTSHRTLVCYKETHDNAHTDPAVPATWTGTWRDPRFSPPADGGRPENSLTGTIFMVNGANFGSIKIPAADGKMRFWRNTAVANQAPGDTAVLPDGTLGYEWDVDADNGFRPAGLFRLSTATYDLENVFLLDFGSTYGAGTATHHMTLYRAPGGALVFGSGTIRWPWGLDSEHDESNFTAFPPDIRMQQATVNLFADMGVQPATIRSGLIPATPSTDTNAPGSTITSPASGTSVTAGTPVTVTGTAADQGGGVVGGIEVSVDSGVSWHAASGRETWSYTWVASQPGSFSILSRAVDDSGNLEAPAAGINFTVTCPCTVMSATATPAVVDSGDGAAVEVGVKFRSETNGFITGLRFYKSAANIGTHVGHLWTKDGVLLSSATFTSETVSGWQQVSFPTAVAITAGTTYIASYHAPNGHYSVGLDYFATAGVDNPPLHFPKNGEDGGNGVFTYGGSGSFPTSTHRASNYWVDVVFMSGTVTAVSPLPGATAVNTRTAVSATFDVALDPASVNGSSFVLLDPQSNQVPAAVTYNSGSLTATLTPTGALNPATTYTAVLAGTTGGIKRSSGEDLGLNLSWRFTTCCSVWGPTIVPPIIQSGDTAAVEVGVKFRSDVDGFVTGIRFYKGPANTGTHVGHLWTRDGVLISSATFTNETASGWQEVSFPTAVAVSAGTTYIASYHAPNGRYSLALDFFVSATDQPPLHFLQDGQDGGNGVFSYGGNGTFPTSTFRASNYWVDIVFTTNLGASGPTLTSISPASGSTAVSVATVVNAGFDQALDPATVNGSTFRLLDASGGVVPASVSYDADNHIATLAPTFGLDFANLYRATITGGAAGIKDSAGNPLSSSVLWLFSTQTAPPGSCPCTVMSATATPAVVDSGDGAAVEVGVKFRSETNGFITGLRFYKSAANIGTHVGHLWTKDGVLLSSATFTNETASGWQQVSFPTAVAITAGTTYIASYHAPNGHYSVEADYFATAGVDNPPLHFLKNGEDGGNGVFTYGGSGSFPTSTHRASNYWVDVVFARSVGGVFGPSVTIISPTSGATGVNVETVVSATFDQALDPATVTSNTFQLFDSASVPIPATVTYDASSSTATLRPDSPLGLATSYRPVIVGGNDGVKNTSGRPMRMGVRWVFTTEPTPAGSCPCSVWNPAIVPSVVDSGDGQAIEVGVRFHSDVNGVISGLRFYKSAGNTGTHTGHLWTNDGTLLASATFTNETASGWQQVNFPTAVPITAGTTYVASYFAPTGHYSMDDLAFAAAGVDNPPLHLLRDGLDGPNGVFAYSATSIFPTSTFRSRNYWVDVVFDTGTPRPVVAATSPANAETGVNPGTTVRAVFAAAMDPTTITNSTFLLLDQFDALVPATVTYDDASNTATLTPASLLPGGASYRAVLRGGNSNPRVKNLNGQSFLTDYEWTFSTASQLLSLTLDSGTVIGGTSANGTVTLRVAAPAGGITVQLSSSNSAVASVPTDVFVPAGATSASFAITTSGVATSTPVNITASLDVVKTAVLTVNPPPLSSLVLNPTSVFSRGTSTGTITLSVPAPVGGSTVALASDNAAATVPASISIPAGSTTGTFTVTASDVAVTTNVNITATLNGVKTAVLTVNPYTVSNLALSPTTVGSGVSSTGTVTLNAAAPTGGMAVALASNNPAATVPASVTVAAGGTTATFAVTTTSVTSSTAVTITATLNGAKTAVLTVNPAALSTLTLKPTSVVGGNNSTGTVTLSGIAPAGGAIVSLGDTNPAATVPASVTIPAGATTATFTVTTIGVAANTTGAISGTYAGVTRNANLTVTPAAISSLALSPATVVGPASSTATVTLNGNAPVGGALVTLTDANAAATIPASVTVAEGARTATFTVTTVAVGAATTGNISGTYRGTTRSANLTVNPLFASITLSPTSLLGGASSTGRANLNAAAPSGGVLITLSSANPAATTPASVTVPAGATTATFLVTTTPVSTVTTGNITGNDGLTTRSANLTVNPATLSSIGRSPSTVVGGNPVTGTATLTGPAPQGGAVVTLTASTPVLSVPPSVTVPAGATSATFTIGTVPVTAITTGTVSGTFGVTRTSGVITVDTADLTSLTLNPSTLAGGNQSIGTVTLTGNAPVDRTVNIFSFNDPLAQVPVSVVIPAGSRSTTFVINTAQVTANTNVTIQAVSLGITRNATLTIRPPRLASVTLNPTTVVGGTPSTGTVTLDGPAAAAGTPVTLSSSNTAAATVPASVLVPAGQRSATFTVTTKVVTSSATVTITGNRVVNQTATLTVTP